MLYMLTLKPNQTSCRFRKKKKFKTEAKEGKDVNACSKSETAVDDKVHRSLFSPF